MFMVKKRTVKHPHPRHVRYPAQLSATVGYVTLVIAWLMVVGTAGVIALESIAALFPFTATYGDYILESIGGSSQVVTEVQEPSLGGQLLLGAMFAFIAALSSHFLTIHTSQLLKLFIAKIGLSLTHTHLFITKCLFALIAPLLMMIVVLGFPQGFRTLSLITIAICGAFAAVGVVSFSVQHVIARRHGMAIKHVL